jgi:hypothetical protein
MPVFLPVIPPMMIFRLYHGNCMARMVAARRQEKYRENKVKN